MGLVGKTARFYLGCGLPFDDLLQEGIRGLMRACDDFEPEEYNVRFTTYASYWIRNAIQYAVITSGSMIRIPNYMINLRTKYRRIELELRSRADGRLESDDPSASLDLDGEIAGRLGISLETLEQVRRASFERTQFHRDGDGDVEHAVEEMIVDDSEPLFDLDGLEEIECLREGLDSLSPIEAWVLRQRYGLDSLDSLGLPDDAGGEDGQADRGPKSIRWIARTYGLSPNTIRRFEAEALGKLREYMEKRVGIDD